MILILLAMVVVAAIAGYRMMLSFKRDGSSDEERTIELLRKTHLMFPSAENDIFALDALYQHTFREVLTSQHKDKPEWEALKHDSILIFNAKNKAIIDAVRFEERHIQDSSTTQKTLYKQEADYECPFKGKVNVSMQGVHLLGCIPTTGLKR